MNNDPHIPPTRQTAGKPVEHVGGKRGWCFLLCACLISFWVSARVASCCPLPEAWHWSWEMLPTLPDKLGVAGAFAGESGGALLVAGGANFPQGPPWEGGRKVWHDAVYVLTARDGTWQLAGRLPRPLGYGITVTTPKGVVCIGGSDAERHYADVFTLRWSGRGIERSPLASLPVPLANAAGALLEDQIYVAGGSTEPGEQAAVNRLFALDLARPTAAWNELEPCPGRGRILATAAAQAGAFYLVGGVAFEPVGGRISRVYLRDTWQHRPGKGWRRLADLPSPVAAAPTPAPTVGSSHFLLLGGDDGSQLGFQPPERHPGFRRQALAYNTLTDTWAAAGDLPAARVTAPTVFWNGGWVIPSGEVRPAVRSPEVRAFRASVK